MSTGRRFGPGTRRRVLVTDAGRGSAIAIIRSLGRQGYEVIAADAWRDSPGFRSKYASRRLRYPDPAVDPAGTAQRILDAVRAWNVQLVIPVTDDIIVPLRLVRPELDRVSCVALPSDDQLDLAADKDRTRRLAASLGLTVPRSAVVRRPDEAVAAAAGLGWPVVVKPLRSRTMEGESGVMAHTVRYAADEAELRGAVADGEPVLLQAYWPGEGHGVEMLLREGVPLMTFQHRRLREVPPGGGASAFRESVAPDAALVGPATALMAAMRWTGLAMVEFRVGPEGAALLEVNGRVWGSLPLAVKAGVDFPAGLAELYLGGPTRAAPARGTRGPAPYRVPVRSRSLPLEIAWIGSVLARRGGGPAGQPPRGRALVVALRLAWPRDGYDVLERDDVAPGLAEIARIVRTMPDRLIRTAGLRETRPGGSVGGRRPGSRTPRANVGTTGPATPRVGVRDAVLAVAGSRAAGRLTAFTDRAGVGTVGSLSVVTFHRIDDPERDTTLEPSLVSATPDGFRRHVELLAATQHPVSAAEVLHAHRNGTPLPPRAVLVTLDDATVDVAEAAWPILRAAGVPALLFVPTAFPDAGVPFWWDRLHATLVALVGRGAIDTPIGSLPIDAPADVASAGQQLRAWAKSVPHAEAMAWIDDAWAAAGAPTVTANVLGWDALRTLAADGLALASHTDSHPLLTRVTVDDAQREVERGRRVLQESVVGALDAVFAYPSGAWDVEAAAAVDRAGIELAFTTDRGVDRIGMAPALALRRINVGRRSSPDLLRAQLVAYRVLSGRLRHAMAELPGGPL